MDFVELSINDLKEKNNNLYNQVIKKFNYDLVIFIAKGSYLIGKEMADLNDVPCIDIKAQRDGGKLKKILSPILKLMPNKLKLFLREKEMNSNHHEKNSDRKVVYDETIWEKYKNSKRILLVDDSIDTGYSMLLVKKEIEKYFESAMVKIAVYNIFDKAKKVIDSDYNLYSNTIIKGPWSNDSKEHKRYLDMYYNWKRSE